MSDTRHTKLTWRDAAWVTLAVGLWTAVSLSLAAHLRVNAVALMIGGWATVAAVLIRTLQRRHRESES
jgi:hypothetical protein